MTTQAPPCPNCLKQKDTKTRQQSQRRFLALSRGETIRLRRQFGGAAEYLCDDCMDKRLGDKVRAEDQR